MVPYLVRHPGTKVSEASRLFDVSEEELVEDLRLLFVSGLPPYGPGDLIDVEVEDGRITISMADYFNRPLRLTRNEAIALYLRGTSLAATRGLPESRALASALDKLREGLGPESLEDVAGRIETVSGRGAVVLERVRAAAAARERIEVDYFAASSGETTTRLIEPEEVFSSIGNWYVAAWDTSVGDERLFRLDRIKAVRESGEPFEPRGLAGAGRPLYTASHEDVEVRLRLLPEARWVAEYYEASEESERPDGSLEVVLPTKRLEWVARLLLSLGRSAEVLEPPELGGRVSELARNALDLYVRAPAG
jgi:proteasome accessory factor C